jgi:hypothetical protein
MKRVALLLCVSIAIVLPGGVFARRPVVVELFTAQGCSSCAKANGLLGQIAERPGVVALTWSVDYWDYLGWKDTFAQPEFTARQQRYERRFSLRDVYTPQVVIDGAAQSPGDRPGDIDTLIQQARHLRRAEPQVRFLKGGRIGLGTGVRLPSAADVWLVRYDPRVQEIEVTAGDNTGAKVPYRNVVRQLSRLGTWSGRPVVFKAAEPTSAGLVTLVLVQAARGGPIIGATQGDR